MDNLLYLDYFGVADEIEGFGVPEDELLTLDDFQKPFIEKVLVWATRNNAPWPPSFQWAEDHWDSRDKML